MIFVLLFGSFSTTFSSEKGVFNVVAQCNLAPYKWIDKDGQLVGGDIDIVKEAFKRAGLKVNIKHMPWKRLIVEMQRGVVDGAFAAYRTKEREGFAHYIDSYPLHYSTYASTLIRIDPSLLS